MNKVKKELHSHSCPKTAKILQGFFKTAPGQYGEGDIFLGVRVPDIRKTAKNHRDLGFLEIKYLLRSPVHEERLLALLLLIQKYRDLVPDSRKEVYNIYLSHTVYINSWDLVDLSAPQIIGDFLVHKDKAPLYRLAVSRSLWERRISIVATFHFIRNNRFGDTLKISKLLLSDEHDLIHKAVGWMLREVGKRDLKKEEGFLKKHYKIMPRTMLRYAIEKFSQKKRHAYLKGGV